MYIEISAEIEKKINQGIYQEGEKLPSERELTHDLQVSRNVIRQALTILREKGIIMIRPGKGAYVTRLKDNIVSDSLKRIAQKYESSIEDILEVREELEISITKKAVQKATGGDVKKLKLIWGVMETKQSRASEYLEEDLNFHVALAASTQNPLFTVLIRSFFDMTEKSPFTLTNLTSGYIDVIQKAQKQHWELIEAIESKDEPKAVRIIRDHMNLFREEIHFLRGQKMI